jgi:hypothetical protein
LPKPADHLPALEGAILVVDGQRKMGHIIRDGVRADRDLDCDRPQDDDDQGPVAEKLDELFLD